MCAHFLSDKTFIDKLSEIIEEHLSDDGFGVKELADKIGLSHSQIHRKLKSISNQSCSSFIREVRLKKARQLLEEQQLNVTEVAYAVGFNSASYFIKCYHDYYGYPPGETLIHEESDTVSVSSHRKIRSKTYIPQKAKVLLAIVGVLLTVALGIQFIHIAEEDKPKRIEVYNADRVMAVLPCKNYTGSNENDFYIEFMHDLLIGELSKIPQLRVISRTSTLKYKNSGVLLKDIAKDLGVNTILESSILQVGDSIRLVVQLIDVYPNENHVMSEEYRESLDNILNLQSSIVKDVAQSIQINLYGESLSYLEKDRSVEPEKFKEYMRGVYDINQGTLKSIESGVEKLQEAISMDPKNAAAYGALALGYATLSHEQYSDEVNFQLAMGAAQTAIQLDPRNDEAYTAIALLYLYQTWEWDKAKEAFVSALKRNQNNDIATAHYAWLLLLQGEKTKAIEYAQKATQLNPLNPSYASWLALLLYSDNRFADAELWAKRALELSQDTPYANAVLSWIAVGRSDFDEALAFVDKLPKSDYYNTFRAYVYVSAGKDKDAKRLYQQMEIKSQASNVNPCYLGMMAAIFGDTDNAYVYLQEACNEKNYPSAYIHFYPFMDNLKKDSRYKELIQAMNLSPEKLGN